MSDKYPLFPRLSDEAQEQAQRLMDGFKVKMKKICDETLGELYVDVSMYIESDNWTNFRNELMDGFQDYRNEKIQGQFDFKKIRAKIFEEYREEIIKDLPADLIEEIKSLKEKIKIMQDYR